MHMKDKIQIITLIVCYLYLCILIILALCNFLISYVNYSALDLGLEIICDVILIAGVFLYIRKIYWKYWIIPFSIALIIQIIQFTIRIPSDISDILFWLIVLTPAFFMNWRIRCPSQKLGPD